MVRRCECRAVSFNSRRRGFLRTPNAEPSYLRVFDTFGDGDPFGYVDGDHFVIIGPAEGKAYLINNEDKISSTDQVISEASSQEIVAKIKDDYPSVGYLTYEIKNYSVGDKINISGKV